MIRARAGVLAAAVCVMLAGCGAEGEVYQPRSTPASRSLIYIYRPYGLLSSQAIPMITCGHESIELETAGFYEFLEDSGPVICTVANDPAQLKFDAHAGEQYFIKEVVETSGLTTHTHLVMMDADVARDQIKECSRQGIKD